MTVLEQIKQLAEQLTVHEKRSLARLLESDEPVNHQLAGATRGNQVSQALRERRLQWLKSHRAEYAGQYVALSGDELVGYGSTIRMAREAAAARGAADPFLVRVTLENDPVFAGW